MILEGTKLVTLENGPRPAGKPNECFYCKEPVGSNHLLDCVLYKKEVKIKVTITIKKQFPVSFDRHDIEFGLNEGSGCASNFIHDLEHLHRVLDCLCHTDIKFELIEK